MDGHPAPAHRIGGVVDDARDEQLGVGHERHPAIVGADLGRAQLDPLDRAVPSVAPTTIPSPISKGHRERIKSPLTKLEMMS
jgi:hypothetical protein